MKTENVLLLGAVALGGYYLWSNRQKLAIGAMDTATQGGFSGITNAIQGVINAPNNIISEVTNALGTNAPAPSPVSSAPVSEQLAAVQNFLGNFGIVWEAPTLSYWSVSDGMYHWSDGAVTQTSTRW